LIFINVQPDTRYYESLIGWNETMIGRSQNVPPLPKRPKLSPQEKKHLDDLLDEALEETFPASDPPAMLEPAADLLQADQDEKK
jgi:hypothetical protein